MDIQKLWAKSDTDQNGNLSWAPLTAHIHDTENVATLLISRWVDAHTLDYLAQRSSTTPQNFSKLAVFLAAVHDIGKATPAFQCMPLKKKSNEKFGARLSVFTDMYHAGVSHLDLTPDEARSLPHNHASFHILVAWLQERHEWEVLDARTLAIVVGAHHGGFPQKIDFLDAPTVGESELLGDAEWKLAQYKILDTVAHRTEVGAFLTYNSFRLSGEAQAFITGLVIASDWLASDSRRFKLWPDGQNVPENSHGGERLHAALKDLTLPAPWAPPHPPSNTGQFLARRFELPAHATPNAYQEALLTEVRQAQVPELYILEAPTGSGKTEAALLAAEELAARFGLAGINLALPTQATTDAMSRRVLRWLSTMSAHSDNVGDQPVFDFQLIHGAADLNKEFQALPLPPDTTGMFDTEYTHDPVYVNPWTERAKLRLLAGFTVCTIDQILMAALTVRHNVLRILGLSRKVLIIDEVHAADTYMMKYLLRAIEWCAALGVPVICMSATLPTSLRDKLLTAYEDGRKTPVKGTLRTIGRRSRSTNDTPVSLEVPVYPRLSSTRSADCGAHHIVGKEPTKNVRLTVSPFSDEEIADYLGERLSEGGRVLILRNTVKSAVSLYDVLQQRGLPVFLSHSRFIGAHRADNDARVLADFGRHIADAGETKILVATQVAEQSLDIDVDLLITDIAPSDLLFQRIGRLHRHPERPRPSGFTTPECVVTSLLFHEAKAPEFSNGSDLVYNKYLLLNTAAIIQERSLHSAVISVPEDVPSWIHHTYDAPLAAPAGWEKSLTDAQRTFIAVQEGKGRTDYVVQTPVTRDPLWGFTSVHLQGSEEEVQAKVRDGLESIEAILIINDHDDLRLLNPPAGIQPDLNIDLIPGEEQIWWMRRSVVRIPGYVTAGASLDKFPGQLESFFPAAWQHSALLKGRLFVLLDSQYSAALEQQRLTYSQEKGLQVSRI
ncbi:CRISPR-associated helicase Cas3' [Jonesia quinghaiensis]|uniref:CRISPR-associated helicase Cas3' n=1 Tax=Jonesia quinghaiensis TaxID=262806 RepID=UPI000415D45A|nr:CRISPR-associated helicase Cas3' [Jonesia quinghaiensis]